MLRAEARLRPQMSAARLLAAPRSLTTRTLHVNHVRQLVPAAAATYSIRIVPVAATVVHTVYAHAVGGVGQGFYVYVLMLK